MFTCWLKDKKLVFLFISSISLKLVSLNESWIEEFYTYGLYPHISAALRILFGWSPVSIGDVLYTLAGLYLLGKTASITRLFIQKRSRNVQWGQKALKLVKLGLAIYLVFNVFWGLNYNRLGIAHQLALEVKPYSDKDIKDLLSVLNERLCYYGDKMNSTERAALENNTVLFTEGFKTFTKAEAGWPFLYYRHPSLKASLYTPLGHYFGFTGYYNPFTAEAQIKTSIPVFLKPFVLCHEIGHQLGYAKENEANFVSFLAGRQSDNEAFRYSVYFEMWLYTWRELMRKDLREGVLSMKTAHPQVQKDYRAFIAYLTRTDNNVEPYISIFYDRYLKLNNQPRGRATYNEVVSWLIAYMKKMGKDAV